MKEETAVILGIAQRTLTQKEFRSLKGWLLSESIILAIFGMPLDIKDLIAKIHTNATAEDRRRIQELREANYSRGKPVGPVHRKAIIDDDSPWQQKALREWEDAID